MVASQDSVAMTDDEKDVPDMKDAADDVRSKWLADRGVPTLSFALLVFFVATAEGPRSFLLPPAARAPLRPVGHAAACWFTEAAVAVDSVGCRPRL